MPGDRLGSSMSFLAGEWCELGAVVKCGAQGLVLAVEVGGHGGEGVEPAVEGGDLLAGVAERRAERGDGVVSGDARGVPGGGLLNAGVPFGEDALGAVDGGVADGCF